jgi:hypothetical protein
LRTLCDRLSRQGQCSKIGEWGKRCVVVVVVVVVVGGDAERPGRGNNDGDAISIHLRLFRQGRRRDHHRQRQQITSSIQSKILRSSLSLLTRQALKGLDSSTATWLYNCFADCGTLPMLSDESCAVYIVSNPHQVYSQEMTRRPLSSFQSASRILLAWPVCVAPIAEFGRPNQLRGNFRQSFYKLLYMAAALWYMCSKIESTPCCLDSQNESSHGNSARQPILAA